MLTYSLISIFSHRHILQVTMAGSSVKAQTVLLLHGPRQAYRITNGYDVPLLVEDDETLIQTHTIGLNPIDWKAP